MSSRPKQKRHPELSENSRPPFIGALLRLTWQRVRSRIHEAVREAGFTDLDEAHLAVFSYPLPDGVRPSELARNMRMSRQAINYLIVQMEESGYLERRAPPGSDRRRIYLSEHGKRVGETIYACLRQLQAEWSSEVGNDQFNTFMDVLRQLSTEEELR
ncbi:MAG TPA: MarR family transcriptional regulator [Hyphomicrobiaceae bacterium]|nr:MarR family transcriptional regulator [Hyphomicrobiaceae bacterium]